jgi:HSP20 family protein
MVRSLLRPFTSDIFEPLDFGGWEWPDDVFAEMDRISREMSRQMNRMFRRFGLSEQPRLAAATYPALDLWEDENCLYVEAELPGMEIGDLEIYVTGNNQLSIRGERKLPAVEGGTWHRQERGCGRFSRLLTLPCEVKTDEVEAQLKDGVLTIKLPKSEASKPRRLAIKAE